MTGAQHREAPEKLRHVARFRSVFPQDLVERGALGRGPMGPWGDATCCLRPLSTSTHVLPNPTPSWYPGSFYLQSFHAFGCANQFAHQLIVPPRACTASLQAAWITSGSSARSSARAHSSDGAERWPEAERKTWPSAGCSFREQKDEKKGKNLWESQEE